MKQSGNETVKNRGQAPVKIFSKSTGQAPVKISSKSTGQAMIMTVVILSGAILGATALASLLILFQFRQASDIAASTKAIYAADAGIECLFFNQYRTSAPVRNCGDVSSITLDNGAEYRTLDTGAGSMKSVGRFSRTARAFEVTF